uniref:Cytochrome P450 93A1 n=1 Tax=Anthurium amnicola TaxID=1678845 RepID=A0A1D1Z4I7_9ARAE
MSSRTIYEFAVYPRKATSHFQFRTRSSSGSAMEEFLHLLPVAFLLCLITLFFSSRKLYSNPKSKPNLPPSPAALPVIGHLHHLLLLGPSLHRAFHKLSARLGPLLYLRLGSVPCVVASDADAAREFLRAHELSFCDRPYSQAVTRLNYGDAGFVFAAHGDYWRFMRRLCVTELLGGRTLERLRWIRGEETRRFFQTLQGKAEKGEEVDVGAELMRLTSNVVGRMVMSKRCSATDGEAEGVRKLVEEASELAGKFNLADFFGFCKKLDLQGLQKRCDDLHLRFDNFMEGVLREKEGLRRREEATGAAGSEHGGMKDLEDTLMDIAEDEGAEIKLTRDNIKSFVHVRLSSPSDH